MQITPWVFFPFNPRSLGRVREGRRRLTGRFPARGSPAARVEGCVSLTGARRTSGWPRVAGRGSEAAARRSRAGRRFRRGEVAWELREVEAVLKVGAVGVERVWGGGSAAGWSSPAFGVSGGGVLGRGVRELAKRGGE